MYDSARKAAVRFAFRYLRRRYRRELRIGIAAAVLIGVAAYLAGRNVPEG
jgi:hypothetical protein